MPNNFKTMLLGSVTLLIVFLFFLSPAGQYIEENLGLSLLFYLRGPQTPPSEVAVIGIDQRICPPTQVATQAGPMAAVDPYRIVASARQSRPKGRRDGYGFQGSAR